MESIVTVSNIQDMNAEFSIGCKLPDDKEFNSLLGQVGGSGSEKMNNSSSALMTSSVASILDDTTPSDSGVQLLDSESSELNESMISSTGLEFDNCGNTSDMKAMLDTEESEEFVSSQILPDLVLAAKLSESDVAITEVNDNKIPDELISSTCSTFDSENIVYRRRIKKSNKVNAPQKKRVSFHEDILNNTKTDNIHIEHGFVTYKNFNKNMQTKNHGRYSWCSEYDLENNVNQFHSTNKNMSHDNNDHYVYRNACSDVLDYNKIDVFNNEKIVKYDNSGVFEYCEYASKNENENNNFYKCNCSSSNSSIESDSSDIITDNNNSIDIKKNYQQSKSNSCDCIGANNNNNIGITENCYYSEPNIDYLEQKNKKSVWSKEKKPKSSCLKKSSKINNTQIILNECELSSSKKNSKLKKFNVHQLSDVNNIIDNSKIIIGSLKNIFSINLTERGVPEGSEDLHTVVECLPSEKFTIVGKPKSFLSKSLDGNDRKDNKNKNFIHNVDEQLRRQNDDDLYAPSTNVSRKNSIKDLNETESPQSNSNYRNKFIINCESIVYEHTGVSYCYDGHNTESIYNSSLENNKSFYLPCANEIPTMAPDKQTPKNNSVKQTLSNIFRTFTDMGNDNTDKGKSNKEDVDDPHSNPDLQISPNTEGKLLLESSLTSSILSDSLTSMSMSTTSNNDKKNNTTANANGTISKKNTSEVSDTSPSRGKNRHLASPMKKKSLTTTSRLDRTNNISGHSNHSLTPDLFNIDCNTHKINNFLSDEFDDILTITTTDTNEDKTNDDMVIIDYPINMENKIEYLKPPSMTSSTTSKTSLINRFLRNVTQKKILEATIKKNNFFQNKLKNEKKICTNLVVKGVKGPRNKNLIEDLNAEIAMEMESSLNQQKSEAIISPITFCQSQQFDGNGIGEVTVDFFNGNCLHILRNEDEQLMKVFKLYTGYSKEGFMTPVLVFLTDKTLYVTDIVRNRICNKFVLPYIDLDVILIGPHGNTVLLSNSARDMQQVLLAGGPYPADKLVSSLELCARRGGSILPAFGELTLDHLAPLQAFVRDNSTILRDDAWKYYAVVNVPAGSLTSNDLEPLGPNLKGPLMHRSLSHSGDVHMWSAGYFLLKAGVLYLFNDAAHKLPTWAVALAECQGVRRSLNAGRPHCFELLLRTGSLQLAAPDEYVASEWLQALIQAASGLFELQERHKTLGCTLIMTSNHLITLREDFTAPLRRICKLEQSANCKSPSKDNSFSDGNMLDRNLSNSTLLDSCSDISSMISASSSQTKFSYSNVSTPTRACVGGATRLTSSYIEEKSFTNMSSFYGKNSGIEILTCASIDEMIGIRIPSESNHWWCILEFSCQEVRESSDDLVIFFSTGSEFQRFLSTLEFLWHSKSAQPFPISLITTNCSDQISGHCSILFSDINKSWEPLLTAALGFPQ